jgi:hypothetical protein
MQRKKRQKKHIHQNHLCSQIRKKYFRKNKKTPELAFG